jgi:hypothetical protein
MITAGADQLESQIGTRLTFARTVDLVHRLRDAGVKRICIGPPGFDLDSVRTGFERFAERVLTRLDG